MLDNENETLSSIVHKAYKLEEYGQRFFCLLDKLAKDSDSREVFRGLSKREEGHLDVLDNIIKGNDLRYDGLTVFKAHDFFNKDLKMIIKEGPVTALKYAIEMEQKMSDFYYSSLRYIDDHSIRRIFLDLIEDEEEHKDILNKHLSGLMDSLLKDLTGPLKNKGIGKVTSLS